MEKNLSPVLKNLMRAAEEKRRYHCAHPEELHEKLAALQKGGPFFGGIGAEEFKRRCADEWD